MTTDITPADQYECLAALYAKRYGKLAPGKDDRTQDSGSMGNRDQWRAWHQYGALADVVDRIIELERELAAARAALEGD